MAELIEPLLHVHYLKFASPYLSAVLPCTTSYTWGDPYIRATIVAVSDAALQDIARPSRNSEG